MKIFKKLNIKSEKKRISISFYYTLVVIVAFFAIMSVSSLSATVIIDVFNVTIYMPQSIAVFLFSMVFGAIVMVFLNRLFFTPLKKLSVAISRVANGDFKARLEEKHFARSVREIYGDFNLMAKQLDSTEILQSDFVSNVSHEIKTPINAIEGYTSLLQSEEITPEEQAEYVEKILFNTKRLSELVANILLLSKIDNQVIENHVTEFRLDEQIRQSIMLLEPKWSAKELELDVELESVTLKGNDKLTIHIWNNLIDNAIKFSPEGGALSFDLRREGDRIVFSLGDDGAGIGEDEIKHIFDKFYQGDTSHKQEGNGLGLSLVKRITDMMGGEICVANKSGGGCVFTVELPDKTRGESGSAELPDKTKG